MKKVYLLLRDNTQSGPFTIDELLQQALKPSDLIWKEGKAAWCHPFEMDEFAVTISKNEKPGFQEPKIPHYKKRPRTRENVVEKYTPPAITSNNLEKRAEELRQRALNYQKAEPSLTVPRLLEEEHVEMENGTLTPDINLVFHKEKSRRSVDLSQPITFILLAVWLSAVWFKGGIPIFQHRSEPAATVATQMIAGDAHAAMAPEQKTVSAPIVNQPAALSIDTIQHKDSLKQVVALPVHKKAIVRPPVQETPETTAIVASTPVSNDAVTKKEEKPQEMDVKQTPKEPKPAAVSTDSNTDKKESTVVAKESVSVEPVKEEKKGGFLRNLFKKKKQGND